MFIGSQSVSKSMTKVTIIIDVRLDRMLAKSKTCVQTFTPHSLPLAKITFFPVSTKHFGCKNVGHLIVVWPHAECRPMVSVCVGEYLLADSMLSWDGG